MRNKYLVGATLALAFSLVAPVSALGSVTSQKLTVDAAPSLQNAKKGKPGPVGINVTVDTFEAPPTPAAQTAQTTVLNFDPAFNLGNTARYPQCNPASLANTTTDQAKILCAPSQVGAGDSTVCSAAAGCGVVSLPGVVTAFNGVPSGGNPTIILHNRIGPPANATTILNGVLTGDTLTVAVPDTAATGLHLTHFFTAVPITRTGVIKKKGKKGKKKQKPKKIFYITAKCLDKVWDFNETTFFRGGAPAQFSGTSQPCQQRKPKKKKKK